MPGCDGAGMAERSYPTSEARGGGREEPPSCPMPGAVARRSNPMPEARGGLERWLHVQREVAARAQEGLEE